jgi:hypothetical protein
MTTTSGFEELAKRARSMRADGATHAEIKARLRVGSSTVSRMLGVAGTGSPRPRITQAVREQARSLRRDGKTVPEISSELGMSRGTAWLITKDIPWTPAHDVTSRQVDAARRRWQAYEERRDVERNDAQRATAEEVGDLSDRELLLIGAVLYWAEGGKSKPWSRREWLGFINSDPDVIRLFLAWLRLLGVPSERLTYRVCIHETAEARAAERFWADVVGIPPEHLQRTTLKRHVAKTVRKNTGDDYHGCLVVRVRKSAREYWRMEDIWASVVRSVTEAVVTQKAR